MRTLEQIWATLPGGKPRLLIACGASKEPTRSRAYQLYKKSPLWVSYRQWRKDQKIPEDEANPYADVWVVSARHGLVREMECLDPYDRELTKQNRDKVVSMIARQVQARPMFWSKPVVFQGPIIYCKALVAAGLKVQFLGWKGPTPSSSSGPGYARQNLKNWLNTLVTP